MLVSINTRPSDPAELWVMDASVGDPVRLSVPQESVGTLALSPQDGELLFTAGNPRPHFWTLSGIDVAGGTNMATGGR